MKFLIQKCNGKITHDFSFTLLESIRFKNWLTNSNDIKVKYLDYFETTDPDNIYPLQWKPMHRHYVPVGSVEFVSEFLSHFYGLTPKPINVPEELFGFVNRGIFNGPHYDMDDILDKRFVKSNDHIKGFKEVIDNTYDLPEGNYQFSELIDIDSEWHCFVYKGKLVGLQNYSGDFTMFPNISHIEMMIKDYKSAPIAYTLDVGVFNYCDTFVIECHDFFSCGLYGFSDHAIYPNMLTNWFWQYIQKEMVAKKLSEL